MIASVWPRIVAAGSPSFTLQVYGSYFDSGAVARWNGAPLPTQVTSSRTLMVDVPAALIAAPGSALVSVVNPDGKTPLFPLRVEITSAPVLTRCTPSFVTAKAPSLTLTCSGGNFVSGSVVTWDNLPLATTFVSRSEVTAFVPGALLQSPGSFPIWVSNPGDGSPSERWYMLVDAPVPPDKPEITGLDVGPMVVGGGPSAITLRGRNFVSGSVIRLGTTNLPTVFVSPTQLHTTVLPSALTFTGPVRVTAVNPDGQTTGVGELTIDGPAILDSVSPATVEARDAAFILTVRGRDFGGDASVHWDGFGLETTRVSDTQLTALVPGWRRSRPRAVAIEVRNGIGPVSARRVVAVTVAGGGVFAVAGWSAPGVPAGSSGVTITVDGAGFAPGAFARWGPSGQRLSSTRIGPTQLEAFVPSSLFTTGAGSQLSAGNPDGTFSIDSVHIALGPIAIASIEPIFVPGLPGAYLRATGVFQSGSVLRWNGTTLTTDFRDATMLSAFVPPSFIAAGGPASVTAVAPNGATSAPVSYRMTFPAPTIGAAFAGDLMAGDPTSLLTLTGTNFIYRSTVTWNGVELATTFVSTTQLQATLPAALLTLPGAAQVRVVNGDGAVSNSTSLSVPPLAIAALSPVSARAGGPAFTLTLNGSFKSTTVVRWNGAPLATTFVDATRLTAAVPASLIAAWGIASVTVVNPGGTASAPAAFPISPPPATITAGGVVNAANAQAPIAPGSLISIYASNLPAGFAVAESTPLPRELNGVSVLIDGIRAPLLFAGGAQVNAQAPYEVRPGSATLALSVAGVVSGAARVEVKPAGPAIFTLPASDRAVAQNADYSLNSADNPARPGQYVILYLVGQGAVEPPVATGAAAPASPLSGPTAAVEAKVGGRPAAVAFAGLAPGMVGVLQVNLLVPAGASGELPVEITIGGVASPPAILSVAAN